MQQSFYFILFLLGSIVFSSCSTSYTLTNGFEAKKIKQVTYVAPFCNIAAFNDLNEKYERDSNTFIVAENISSLLRENKSAYHLTEKIEIPDSSLRFNFYSDALSLATSIDEGNKIKNKTITPNIVQVLNNQNEEHLGLVIYNRILPSKKQKQEKTEKIIASSVVATMSGFLFGGAALMLYPDSFKPLKKGGFYLLVFDKTTQKICYYKKVVFSQNDYKNKKILKDKMDMLFEMFVVPQY